MNEFSEGDRVEIYSHDQHDRGIVVVATRDDDGRKISDGHVAVRVENGQGTWGFRPGELTRVAR